MALTTTRAKGTDMDVNERYKEGRVTHIDARESSQCPPRSWGIEWRSDPFCTVSQIDLGQYPKGR